MRIIRKQMKPKISPLSDAPCDVPSFGFDGYADGIVQMIHDAHEKRFTVGIFGGYGSGKTTLMRLIRRKLAPDHFVRIEFNAWRYEREEHLFVPFVYTLCQEQRLFPEPALGCRLVAAARGLIRGASFKLGVGETGLEFSADSALDAENEALKPSIARIVHGYLDLHRELENVIAELKKSNHFSPIVVFVDDLDRCVPEKAFALLEAIKVFADIDGFIFIIGLDPRVISVYLHQKYGREFPVSSDEYLQKMFQVPFYLPITRGADLAVVLRASLGDLRNEWAENIQAWANDERYVRLLKSLPVNVRQLKRLLNTHQLILSISHGSVQSAPLLAVLLVSSRWPKIYGLICLHGIEFPGIQEREARDPSGDTVVPDLHAKEWREYYRDVLFPILGASFENIDKYVQFIGNPILATP